VAHLLSTLLRNGYAPLGAARDAGGVRSSDIARGVGLTRLVTAVAGTLATGAWLAAPAPAADVVSANWAGYAASRPASAHERFDSVSGSWIQPAAACRPGSASYAAVWVGLGGLSSRSRALEQIGTEVDCSRSADTFYSTWLELVPAAPQTLQLKVHPGDRVSASVTVAGHGVTLRLRDVTTGQRFSTTRRADPVDRSSAEWIVEAPSICAGTSACSALALTDFGTLSFSSASATAGGHSGPIEDPRWTAGALELRQGPGRLHRRNRPRFTGARTPIVAVPSALSGHDGAFTVTWGEQPNASGQPTQVAVPE
jgi:Peptidase A4 family